MKELPALSRRLRIAFNHCPFPQLVECWADRSRPLVVIGFKEILKGMLAVVSRAAHLGPYSRDLSSDWRCPVLCFTDSG
jgi:hypothetical protein